jgi:hypothetical protein
VQFVGVAFVVFGYASVYTGVQMLKRPAGGSSGSFLYWLTGIESLGAPSGGSGNRNTAGGGSGGGGTTPTGSGKKRQGVVPGRPGGR